MQVTSVSPCASKMDFAIFSTFIDCFILVQIFPHRNIKYFCFGDSSSSSSSSDEGTRPWYAGHVHILGIVLWLKASFFSISFARWSDGNLFSFSPLRMWLKISTITSAKISQSVPLMSLNLFLLYFLLIIRIIDFYAMSLSIIIIFKAVSCS